ncbi:MAG: cell division protein SepF [Euryarchaeota archaeon]|nr:cell division protein SepF [Euryarchaeota archaeon]
MALWGRKPFSKVRDDVPTIESDQFIDLGAMTFEGEASSGGEGMIKIAEVYRYEDLANITPAIYDGAVMMIDYSHIANDNDALRRITSELKAVARDTNGDVAAIGGNYIVVAPSGVRIDRQKIRGGFH